MAISRTNPNYLTPRELHNFKLQALFVFVLCAFTLQLWFAFQGHKSLQDKQPWDDIIVSNTRIPRSQKSEHIERQLEDTVANTDQSRYTKRSLYRQKSRRPSPPKKIEGISNIPMISRTGGHILSMKWDKLCCQSVNCLRKHPLFPLLPSSTSFLKDFRVSNSGRLYGQRVTGRLSPPISGKYVFLVKCMASCEVWFGEDQYPTSSKLFIKVVHGVPLNLSVDPQPFEAKLSSSKTYFIDVVLTVYKEVELPLEVSWKLPNSRKYDLITQQFLVDFSEIPESHIVKNILQVYSKSPSVRLTPFLESIEEEGEDDDDFETIGKESPSNETFYDHLGMAVPVNRSQYAVGESFSMKHKFSTRLPLLKPCVKEPSYVLNGSLPKYAGIWRTVISSVFPGDKTGHMMCIGNRYPLDCQGNKLISNTTIQKLLALYTRALSNHKTRYVEEVGKLSLPKEIHGLKVSNVINIEEKKDLANGSRFLLDTVLSDSESNLNIYQSSYVRMDKERKSLCVPRGFVFNMETTVNVVVVVKNQTRWLRHFLANMEKIYVTTNDKHLNIIIAYYGKEDAKLMKEFASNRLPNIRTVRHFGKFHKTRAIQSGVDTIRDPNSIIFLMDLHMLVPDTMISLVRKHTIRGKTVFNPIVFRLSPCGSPASYNKAHRGFWETFGYGILGIFKSDWDRIGGMSSKKYNRGWGGEDWELVDRIVAAGLDVERLRVPNFYHFFHSKKNMWN